MSKKEIDETRLVDGNTMSIEDFLNHVTKAAVSSSSDYLTEIEKGKKAICNFQVSLIVNNDEVDKLKDSNLSNSDCVKKLVTLSQTYGCVNVPANLADLMFDMMLNAFLPMWKASNARLNPDSDLKNYKDITTDDKINFLKFMLAEYEGISEFAKLLGKITDLQDGKGGTIN